MERQTNTNTSNLESFDLIVAVATTGTRSIDRPGPTFRRERNDARSRIRIKRDERELQARPLLLLLATTPRMLGRATAAMMPCALLLMMMRLMLLLSSSSSMVGPTCRGVVAAAIDAPVASSSSSAAAAKAATIADDPPDPSHLRSHRRGWWLTLPQRPSFGAEGGGRYRRSAWLDSATGIASSKESSTVPFGATSRLHKRIIGLGGGGAQGAGDGEKDADDDSALLKWVEDWARQYPTWLCSGSVTGGLLRAVFVTGPGGKHASKRQQQQQQQHQRVRTGKESVEIWTRIGNWHLLTFGPCQASQRITYRESRKDPDRANRTPKAEEATTTDNNDDVVLTSHCTVVLPVTGGVLALAPLGGGRNDREKRGALLFSVKKQRLVAVAVDKASAEVHADRGDGPSLARSSSEGRPLRLQLSTALAGYRPALAGSSLPIPKWRQTLYLNTQAVLHGYIMWRFHQFGWSGASNTSGGGGGRSE